MAEKPDPPSLANALQHELMEALKAMPGAQAAQAAGHEGSFGVPPEQYAEALLRQLEIVVAHLPRIAEEVDRLRWEAAERGVYGREPTDPRD